MSISKIPISIFNDITIYSYDIIKISLYCNDASHVVIAYTETVAATRIVRFRKFDFEYRYLILFDISNNSQPWSILQDSSITVLNQLLKQKMVQKYRFKPIIKTENGTKVCK